MTNEDLKYAIDRLERSIRQQRKVLTLLREQLETSLRSELDETEKKLRIATMRIRELEMPPHITLDQLKKEAGGQ